MPALAAARFQGFDTRATQFWHELAAEMTRDWFTANKQRYESLWLAPMTALLDDVARRIASAYKPLALGAPKVLRIYRDVRFSNDKTPYKTHIGAAITVAGNKVGEGGNAALYVHLGLDEEFVGVGCYRFDAAKLAAWRKAVVGKAGGELVALIREAAPRRLHGQRPRRLQEGPHRVRGGSSARGPAQEERADRRVPRDPGGPAPQAGVRGLAGQARRGDGAARGLAAPPDRVGDPPVPAARGAACAVRAAGGSRRNRQSRAGNCPESRNAISGARI